MPINEDNVMRSKYGNDSKESMFSDRKSNVASNIHVFTCEDIAKEISTPITEISVPTEEDEENVSKQHDAEEEEEEEEKVEFNEVDEMMRPFLDFSKSLLRHYVCSFVKKNTRLGFDVSISICANTITTSVLHLDIAFGLLLSKFLDEIFHVNETSDQIMTRCYKVWKSCNFEHGDFMTFVGMSKLSSNNAIRIFPYRDKYNTKRFDVQSIPIIQDDVIVLSRINVRYEFQETEYFRKSYERASSLLKNSSHAFSGTPYEDLNEKQLDLFEKHITSNSDKVIVSSIRIIARERDRIRRCVNMLKETQNLRSLCPILLESSMDMIQTYKMMMNLSCDDEHDGDGGDYVVLGSNKKNKSKIESLEQMEKRSRKCFHGVRVNCFDGVMLLIGEKRRGIRFELSNDLFSSKESFLVTRLGASGLKIWTEREDDEEEDEVELIRSQYARLAMFGVAIACWIGGIVYVLRLPRKSLSKDGVASSSVRTGIFSRHRR